MKKLFIAALLVASLTGFAQKKNGAEKMLDKMTTELSLTADQQAQLKPIFEEQAALQKDNKENPDNVDANKDKAKEIGKKINGILTPEQKKLRKEFQEKAKAEKDALTH
ncbi:hypothetical protein [Flavobacterium sp. 7A]|uniref:hypothetical protein n=1 Tax=Flavobacterium sp. 7A TaxID=2940571 RepID=UPI0022271C46|nr:hypothetical protein [Flavobacterium sp. 7A]MCW2118722.1 Spy/CpxP family protein refolding chaperone [Flavobacterium sp. 7A]